MGGRGGDGEDGLESYNRDGGGEFRLQRKAITSTPVPSFIYTVLNDSLTLTHKQRSV